jgi:hypothetical protein
MDFNDFVSCVGKGEDAPEVQRLLSSLGITKKLKMPNDDIDVRHRLPERGLSLIFKPENPKSSRLILTAVQFMSDAEQGWASYDGALPGKILLSDGHAQTHAKLGPPKIEKPKLRLDIWQLQNLRLAINYTKDEPQRVAVITLQLPPKEKD